MDWRKYTILLAPFIIGLVLVKYLPVTKSYYLFILVLVFWVIYYTWVAMGKKKAKK